MENVPHRAMVILMMAFTEQKYLVQKIYFVMEVSPCFKAKDKNKTLEQKQLGDLFINSLQPSAAYLYPLKTSEKQHRAAMG